MASFKQGDIVSIPFPYSDHPASSKLRPALIISNKVSNDLDCDYIFLPITTQKRFTEFSFELDNRYLSKPLPQNSEVRCNKIFTLRYNLIEKSISKIDSNQLKEILKIVISAIN